MSTVFNNTTLLAVAAQVAPDTDISIATPVVPAVNPG